MFFRRVKIQGSKEDVTKMKRATLFQFNPFPKTKGQKLKERMSWRDVDWVKTPCHRDFFILF